MSARSLTSGVVIVAFVALASSTGVVAASAEPASHPGAGHSRVVPTSAHGRGADVGFTEYSAVGSQTNGTVIGPSYNLYTLAAEAVGRTAVTLDGAGQYVQFTLARPANAVDLRYSLPDSADGSGLTAPLHVFVNGRPGADLTLTSKYTWFYGSYPFTNNPADLHGHHMYDDVRTMFGATLPPGTRCDSRSPTRRSPSPSTSRTLSRSRRPHRGRPARCRCSHSGPTRPARRTPQPPSRTPINAGSQQHRAVYLPPGEFTVTAHLMVNDVTLTGAGEWYTVLHRAGVGVYGDAAPNPSTNVHLSNFAIFGEVQDRVDSADVNGIGGAMGGGSTIEHLWIQHTKVGMWFTGPFDGLTISDVRLQDLTADGINFDGGITHATVENSYIRNTGDDGLAMWSSGAADSSDAFRHDTVVLPILANNFAIYGGHDNSITGNYGTDTMTQGGGIQVGNRFAAVPLSGTTLIAGNTLVRTGTLDPNWQFGVGAIWFYASDEDMTGTINVDNNTILDSPYDAFGFVGDYIPNATRPPRPSPTSTSTAPSCATWGRSWPSSSRPDRPPCPTSPPPASGWTADGLRLRHRPYPGHRQQRLERLRMRVPPVQHPEPVCDLDGLRPAPAEPAELGAERHHHQPGTGRGEHLVGAGNRRVQPDEQLPAVARRRGQLHGHRRHHARPGAELLGQPGHQLRHPVRAVHGEPVRRGLQPERQSRADRYRVSR